MLVVDDVGVDLLGSCKHAGPTYSGLVDSAAVQPPTGRPPYSRRQEGAPQGMM